MTERLGILKDGRLGRLAIQYELIVGSKAWFLANLTTRVSILEARNFADAGLVEYIGRSSLFDWISETEEIPWYKIEMRDVDHQILRVERFGDKRMREEGIKKSSFSGEEESILRKLFKA